MKARLQEEGREARNLVAYSLPLQASSSSSSQEELQSQGVDCFFLFFFMHKMKKCIKNNLFFKFLSWLA